MAEQQPSLQIDNDWKKEAQEEKRKLAEKDQQAKAQVAAPGLIVPGSAPESPAAAGPAGATGAAAAARGRRETPVASFTTLVSSLLTQILLYLGELATQAGPMLDLDRAKHQLDTLTMLEEKTKNNLTEDEQKTLDSALYEGRMRYVSVAQQYI